MSTLAELQKCELQILKDVARLCETHSIRYYLVFGTLLGAVRHKGFIPWDDDIDICMEAKDINRFVRFAKKELGSQYYIQTPGSERNGRWLFCKVRKNGTLCLQRNEERIDGFHQGVWIDIFPIVDLSENKRIKQFQLSIILYLQRQMYNHVPIGKEKTIKNLLKRSYDWFFMCHEYFTWKVLLFLGIIKKKGTGQCCIIGKRFMPWAKVEELMKYTFERKLFSGKTKKYVFEDTCFMSIEDANSFLTSFYGDYMIPVKYSHIEDYSAIEINE